MKTKSGMMATRMRTALVLALTIATAAGCGRKERPGLNGAENGAGAISGPPITNSANFATSFKEYPEHVVTPTPWAGYWFPYTESGIYAAATKYDTVYVASLRARGIDTSSYEPVADWETKNHGPSVWKLEPWFGHCNGWSASAIAVPEPQAPKTIGGLEFSISDQKALLAESWLEFSGDFVGTRVNDKGDYDSAAFWDVVPAQFYLMMVNLVGKQNRTLILDRHTGHEIWNQPLAAYRMEPVKREDYLGPHPQHPDIYRVNVSTYIWWANDNVPADVTSPAFDMAQMREVLNTDIYQGRLLKYELWLDAPVEFDAAGNMVSSGNILVTQENGRYVGGQWKNGVTGAALVNTHPDYLWMVYGKQHSSGYKNPKIDDVWVRENIADEHVH